jgi:surface antigen
MHLLGKRSLMVGSNKSYRLLAAEKLISDDRYCATRLAATSMVRLALLVAVLCFYAFAQPANVSAQVNPFYNQEPGPGLHGDDWALMHAAAARLYRQEQVAAGAATRWSNPKTGDSGTVTVLQSFKQNGMACRKVRYDIRLGGTPGSNLYTVNWCRIASGEWKIAS